MAILARNTWHQNGCIKTSCCCYYRFDMTSRKLYEDAAGNEPTEAAN